MSGIRNALRGLGRRAASALPYNRGGERSPVIDAVRGAAITLVVLGHAIQQHVPAFDSSIAFRAIYSFHMPLFMAVSGFLAAGRVETGFLGVVARKARQLVVPFLAWYGVGYVASWLGSASPPDLAAWSIRLWVSPDNGLWFLWVLFVCFVLASAVTRVSGRFGTAALIAAAVMLYALPLSVGGFGLVRWLFPFFVGGYAAARHRLRGPASFGVRLVPLIGWLALVPFWRRTGALPVELWASAAGLPGSHLLGTAYRYAIAAAGVLAVVWFLEAVATRWSGRVRPLLVLGAFSMDVYVSHQYFTALGLGRGATAVAVAFLIGLIGPLALSVLILRPVRITRGILLGDWKSRAPAANAAAA